MKRTTLCLLSMLMMTSITSCNKNTPVDSSNEKESEQVSVSEESSYESVVDLKLDAERSYTGQVINNIPNGQGILTWVNTNCVYTGEFKNGVYDGQGTFKWNNLGDTLEGTFKDGNPTYGKYTYSNTMSYTGEFNQAWQFNGQGTFNWRRYNTDGTVFDEGWLYEGEFKNGTMAGCSGKLTLDQTDTKEGLIYFEGVMSGFPAIKPYQQGNGKIRFNDKSIYVGDLYYDTNNVAYRKGYGIQDFSACKISSEGAWGAQSNEYFSKYAGEFDCDVNGWIYGNGIMYYTDKMGQPTRYAKGFFSACHLIGEYKSETTELLDGYNQTMESRYLRFREDYDKYLNNDFWAPKHYDYVFCGDSYATFMNTHTDTLFEKYFGNLDAIDTGCGGSTTTDWLNYYQDLIKPYTPNNVVIDIGGNDVANGATVAMVKESYTKLLNMIFNDFPTCKVYMIGVWKTPSTKDNFTLRAGINEMLQELENTYANATYIPEYDLTVTDLNSGTVISDLADYFLSDGLHMNDKGYTLWTNRIKEYLD